MGLLSVFNNKKNTFKGKISILSKAEYANAVKQSFVQLVDVRTKNEVDQGKIGDAIHIDFFNSNFENEVLKLDRSKDVYIYCRSGKRSRKAVKIMLRLGFTHVIDLAGGYINYR